MNWTTLFKQEQTKAYYKELMIKLEHEYATKVVYPKKQELFSCFFACPYDKLKVVILGQDPYHEVNQANGLAFSVYKGNKIPKSLGNIFIEMQNDVGCAAPTHGDLNCIAQQGVLLLNTTLSVVEGKANSHRGLGWSNFIDNVISYIELDDKPIVYILWGKNAQEYRKLMVNSNHYVIESVHPSPLSAYRGFFGSKPFSKTNTYLKEHDIPMIDWQIKE
ncbi:MAG: uracil-DNA glycosylase [Erysipelotrichaceae bacterium]